jgi:hypothetical protein
MTERRRAKPGGDSFPVTTGEMAQVPASGRFRLVYLVFNSLFGLLSQERQAQCFAGVGRVLEPGGMFVIECFVPDLARFDHDQRVQARAVSEDSAVIEVSRHDRVRQRAGTQMITFDSQGMHLRPTGIRYSWPASWRWPTRPACGWPDATPAGTGARSPRPATATSPFTSATLTS